MLFAIPIGIGGTIMARPVIVALFGPSFADATFAFQILIWSASLAFLGANYGYCLVACQQQKALAIAATIGTSTNILLNFMLIPPLGILGACLATIIAQIVMLFCEATAFISRVSRTLPSTSITLKASVAGVAMGFGIICLNGIINWPGQILFGIVVYFLILWILGGIPLHALLSFRRS